MKHTKEMHIHSRRDFDSKCEFHLLGCKDMAEYGYIYVGPTEVSFDVPDDFNMTAAEIATLQKAKAKVQADAHLKVMKIEEQIQSLQCLEYRPE